ncbi:MAG: histidinol dehydrogenase [Oscillospiraceae bacterium]|jgi:histidinol dehydrogenase|nr:histidinol dehydrogenase [Oscillospiraceae bacterium]
MIKICNISEMSLEDIFPRRQLATDVSAAVSGIIAEVRARGDEALREYTLRFDGVRLDRLELSEAERREALRSVESEFMEVLGEAARNIRAYHGSQLHGGYQIAQKPGVILGQKLTPLASVGLYIPGGTASYPSSVLMNCIPAVLAGVTEIVMTTPPGKDGRVDPNIIAAAELAGVGRIFKCGGAQAVAALAYGTDSLPRVDKIVGPGNVYVAEAKRQVFGVVGIDMLAGPSEVLVIADGKSDPVVLAADLLAQAEHDEMARAVLITDDAVLAGQAAREIETQLLRLPRQEIARAAIENNGRIIVADSIEQAIALSNEIAPEHLELCVDEPFDYLGRILNAGAIFLGRNCPEPLGDYFAGTNHTLPTGGTARFSSALSVADFVKRSSYIYYSAQALDAVGDKIAYFADQEGLHAHAVSATIRSGRRGRE